MQVEEFVSTVSFLCALSQPSLNFFSKSKWQITELVRTLSFLSAFSTPLRHFLEIEVPNPGSGVHPKLFLCLFSPPPSLFWKSKWQIQELVGTHRFLCAFSTRRRIFRTSNWQIQELVGTLSFLCGFSLPPSQVFFFRNQSAKSRSWCAPSTFSLLFHGLPSFFWKSKWQIQELVGTLSFLSAFSTRRRIFRTSNWQIQEFVSTLNFLCGFSLPLPQVFFVDQSGKSKSCWAPSIFSVLFQGSEVSFENQSGKSWSWWAPSAFCVGFQSPPPQVYFGDQSGKSRRWWAPLAFCALLHTHTHPIFFEMVVRNPGGSAHPQLFVRSFTPPPRHSFWKSKWQIQEVVCTVNFLSAFSSTPHFIEMEVRNSGGSGHAQLTVWFFTPPHNFFWKSKWQIQQLVGTLSFLCAFSLHPLPRIFWKSNCKPRSWCAPSAFCALFHTHRHPIFLEIEVEVQELVGTLNFLSVSSRAPMFFGNRSGKSKSLWAPSNFYVPFHSTRPPFYGNRSAIPGVGGDPQLSVYLSTPPPPIFCKSKCKSSSCWAPPAFCVPFHSTPSNVFEM